MAELLSVQVHVPITKGEDGKLLEHPSPEKGFTKLKKIENTSIDKPKSAFAYLPKRRAVDIEFNGLTYSVSEGRKRSKWNLFIFGR